MIEYIKVIKIEGYSNRSYTYVIEQESFNIYLINFTFK